MSRWRLASRRGGCGVFISILVGGSIGVVGVVAAVNATTDVLWRVAWSKWRIASHRGACVCVVGGLEVDVETDIMALCRRAVAVAAGRSRDRARVRGCTSRARHLTHALCVCGGGGVNGLVAAQVPLALAQLSAAGDGSPPHLRLHSRRTVFRYVCCEYNGYGPIKCFSRLRCSWEGGRLCP